MVLPKMEGVLVRFFIHHKHKIWCVWRMASSLAPKHGTCRPHAVAQRAAFLYHGESFHLFIQDSKNGQFQDSVVYNMKQFTTVICHCMDAECVSFWIPLPTLQHALFLSEVILTVSPLTEDILMTDGLPMILASHMHGMFKCFHTRAHRAMNQDPACACCVCCCLSSMLLLYF